MASDRLSSRARFAIQAGAIAWTVILTAACGKSLTQMLFAPSVQKRAGDSLGFPTTPTGMTPTDPDRFKFAVLGDIQVRDENKTLLDRFRQDVVSEGIEFFVVCGDLTEDGTTAQLQNVKAAMDGVGIPYYVTIGNHDLFQDEGDGGWSAWKQVFGPATYSVTIANRVRFLFIDTASGDVGERQFDWLESELETQVPFTFVGSHYPIYDGITPLMWRLESVEERYKLTSLMNRKGVYAFIAGHVHGMREAVTGSVKHFITGGMYSYELDYGTHGYLLFSYEQGQMSWRRIEWDDVPEDGVSSL